MPIAPPEWQAVVQGNTINYGVTALLWDKFGNPINLSASTQSLDVSRSATTDVPGGTRFISGDAAAEATLVLSGNILYDDAVYTIYDFFNPWNTNATYYLQNWNQCKIQISMDVEVPSESSPGTTEIISQIVFTGLIDDLKLDLATGTVTLTCVDYRSLLRSSATLPSVFNQWKTSLYPIGLTAGYAMEAILRDNKIYTGPPPSPYAQFYASFHGSMYPEVGTFTYFTTVDSGVTYNIPNFIPGKWTQQLCSLANVTIDYPLVYPTSGFAFEWWQQPKLGGPGGGPHDYGQMEIFDKYSASFFAFGLGYNGDANNLTMSVFADNGAYYDPGHEYALGIKPDGQFHHFVVWMTATGVNSYSFQAQVDGVMYPLVTYTLNGTNSNPAWPAFSRLYVTYVATGPMDTVQVISYPSSIGWTPTPENFTPTAYLEASRNTVLSYLPDVSTEDPWTTLQNIAEAEQGIAGFDVLGTFRFTARNSPSTSTNVRNINSDASLVAATLDSDSAAIATDITVPYTSASELPSQIVWSATTLYSVNRGQTLALICTADAVVVSPDLAVQSWLMPDGDTGTGYRANTKADGSGTNIGLILRVTQLTPTTFFMTIYNPTAQQAFLVSPAGYADHAAGDPTLQIGGVPVVTQQTQVQLEWPDVSIGGAAVGFFGDIALTTSANEWIQSNDIAMALAGDLLSDLCAPRPLLSDVSIIPDGSLGIGDRVTVVNDRAQLSIPAIVVNSDLSLSSGNAAHTLDLATIGTPGAWILGLTGHSEMGVDTRL